jgi:hypothetical protein
MVVDLSINGGELVIMIRMMIILILFLDERSQHRGPTKVILV